MGGMLQDKVIIVTGGGSGIGATSARLFAEEGAWVVVADRDAAQGAAVVDQIGALGHKARFIAADVSHEGQVESMIGTVLSENGRIDGAFNNAGIGPTPALIADCSESDWQRVLAVNLTGVFLCVKHEIRAMLRNSGGAIVNMSSVAGLRAVPMQVPYCVSKHGVIGITRTAAAEYAKAAIRVNALCPGVVDTPATRATGVDWNKVAPAPMGRIARAGEIAELAAWLLSDRASYVTGQAYAIDGGMTATAFTMN